jgi:hypothetical protein
LPPSAATVSASIILSRAPCGNTPNSFFAADTQEMGRVSFGDLFLDVGKFTNTRQACRPWFGPIVIWTFRWRFTAGVMPFTMCCLNSLFPTDRSELDLALTARKRERVRGGTCRTWPVPG